MKYYDYEVNEEVLILYEMIQALESNFFLALPNEVRKSMKKFKQILIRNLEINNKLDKSIDYSNCKCFMRIYYEK